MGVIAMPYIGLVAPTWAHQHGLDAAVSRLALFLFQTTDALYTETERAPSMWGDNPPGKITSKGTRGLYLHIPSAQPWAHLRSLLGLAGDAYCIAKCIETKTASAAIHAEVLSLIAELDRFRDARNFFAHLDQRLGNPERHGVSGDAKTGCGIEYIGAAGCLHLMVVGNALHFTNEGVAEELDISKASFLRLLQATRPIYAALTRHWPAHLVPCPPPAQIYS